ncbi:MAG TPA: hypothetical protein VHM90_22020 [Phycisphaerae bacterium]|nr:hypothetical protein [Phycisphaerae bacterium]
MKNIGIVFLLLSLASCSPPPSTPSPPPPASVPASTALKDSAKAKFIELNQAMFHDDFDKLVDFTHPNVLKIAGGRQALKEVMMEGAKQMRATGIPSPTIDAVSDPVAAESDVFLVITYRTELKSATRLLQGNTFVIAVSPNQGGTWYFVNGDLPPENIQQAIPNLPPTLKLPPRQQPIVTEIPSPTVR